MESFGYRLRKLREERGLPLRKVAAYLDIDTSILSKIERGERPTSKDIIAKFASYFELDEKKLITEYLSEKVAQNIYLEENVVEILKVAEEKVKYFRSVNAEQGSIFK